MKYRNGFVTNSSSSSFVVSVKHFPITGLEHQYPFIGKVISEVKEFLTSSSWVDEIKDEKSLIAYYHENWSCGIESFKEDLDEDGNLEKFEKQLEAIKSGRMMFTFDLSTESSGDAEIGTLFELLKGESWIEIDGTYGDF